MTASDEIRVGLVGYGLSGRVFHAPLLSAIPGFTLTTIVTGNPARQAQARGDHPGTRVIARPEELWSSADEHELAVIATDTGSHVSLASAALEAGLAVVVEKPFAPSAAQARRVVEEATRLGRLLSVFHNRRWDSDHLTLRRLMGDGDLGEVMRYESRFERWRPEPNPAAWREHNDASHGGGVLLDLGIHLADQALNLFGPVRSVYAEVYSRRGGADDDVFMALEHSSGVRSHLWAGALSAAPGPRLRVLGTRAAFVVRGLDGQEDALRAGRRPGEPGFGEEPEERWGRLRRGETDEPVRPEPGRWLDFYAGIERAIREVSPPPVDPWDALSALEVLDAARLSAAEHTVVQFG